MFKVLILAAQGVRGQLQREGDVIHVIAQVLEDLSSLLASVGGRSDVANVYQVSRADVVKHGMGPDPRAPARHTFGQRPRDMFDPDLRLGSGIVPGQTVGGHQGKGAEFSLNCPGIDLGRSAANAQRSANEEITVGRRDRKRQELGKIGTSVHHLRLGVPARGRRVPWPLNLIAR